MFELANYLLFFFFFLPVKRFYDVCVCIQYLYAYLRKACGVKKK